MVNEPESSSQRGSSAATSWRAVEKKTFQSCYELARCGEKDIFGPGAATTIWRRADLLWVRMCCHGPGILISN